MAWRTSDGRAPAMAGLRRRGGGRPAVFGRPLPHGRRQALALQAHLLGQAIGKQFPVHAGRQHVQQRARQFGQPGPTVQ